MAYAIGLAFTIAILIMTIEVILKLSEIWGVRFKFHGFLKLPRAKKLGDVWEKGSMQSELGSIGLEVLEVLQLLKLLVLDDSSGDIR